MVFLEIFKFIVALQQVGLTLCSAQQMAQKRRFITGGDYEYIEKRIGQKIGKNKNTA